MTREEYLRKEQDLWKILKIQEHHEDMDFEALEERAKEIFIRRLTGINEDDDE